MAFLQIDRAVPAAVRHQIDDGRETRRQISLRVDEGDELAVLKAERCWRCGAGRPRRDARSAWCRQRIAVHHVEVRVDQAGQHRRTTEIDHACARGNLRRSVRRQ